MSEALKKGVDRTCVSTGEGLGLTEARLIGSGVAPGGTPGLSTDRRSLLARGSVLLGLAALPVLAGCSDRDDGQEAPDRVSRPVYDSGELVTGVDIAVDFAGAEPAARIDSRFAGLSYEKNELAEPLFLSGNSALVALFRLLGPAVLRIGANQVDRSSWRGGVDDLTPIVPEQIDAFAGFVEATGWQVIYGVNMARNTSDVAAEEASYVESKLGSSLLVWEIGNEPDLYRRLEYRADDWDYDQYLEEWRELRDAMTDVTPAVPFCGPSTTFDLSRIALPFAADVGGERTPMLTQHYYRADGEDPRVSIEQLLRPDRELQMELDLLVATAAWADMPQGLRLNECNSFFNAGAKGVSNGYGSALWVLDFMFTCAVAGCRGVNLHGGGSGPGYTPIADKDGEVIEARPVFYGMLMFTQACPGLPAAGVRTAAGEVDVRSIGAWRVTRDDGGSNIVLMNKSGTNPVSMSVAVTQTRFDPLWLRGEDLLATEGHTLGGVGIGADGSWQPVAEAPVEAAGGRIAITLPKASAVLLRSV